MHLSPLAQPLFVASLLLVAGTAGAQDQVGAPPAPASPQANADLLRHDVEFLSGDVRLAGTILRPPGAGRRPGVVFVHGSGASARENPWTTAWAEALAEQGLVVLYPDKRGSGASGGDWLQADFGMLAEDAAAGVRLLREQPDVDPARVGVLGFSQGGYVAPLVPAREPGCRLVATVSGGVQPLLVQIVDEIALEAETEGAPLSAEDEAAVREVYAKLRLAARDASAWPEVERAATAARARGAAVTHALRTLPSSPDSPMLRWADRVADFDPLPTWASLPVPALLVYGAKDTHVRVRASVDRLATLGPGRRDVAIFGENGHALFRADAVALVAKWFEDGGAP